VQLCKVMHLIKGNAPTVPRNSINLVNSIVLHLSETKSPVPIDQTTLWLQVAI